MRVIAPSSKRRPKGTIRDTSPLRTTTSLSAKNRRSPYSASSAVRSSRNSPRSTSSGKSAKRGSSSSSSVRKPKRPVLMPRIGTSPSTAMRAARSSVPSPPTVMNSDAARPATPSTTSKPLARKSSAIRPAIERACSRAVSTYNATTLFSMASGAVMLHTLRRAPPQFVRRRTVVPSRAAPSRTPGSRRPPATESRST